MKKIKETLWGLLFFFITIFICSTVSIVVYVKLQGLPNYIRYICIILLILFLAMSCTIIDLFRRKIMVEKPLKDILDATDEMSKGNFNIVLHTNHQYGNYDEFDEIKIALNNISKKLSKNEIISNDFIANFSHEIKTPISIIKNYVTILQDKTLTEEEKEKYLGNLKNSCTKLNNFVTSILKLNKLENQVLVLNKRKINISEILINSILEYDEYLNNKNIILQTNIIEDLIIYSEESYVEIIFNNLINNAIKFSNDCGEIVIKLYKDLDSTIFIISDNGCGMTKETGEHIFDKFYQGDTSRSSIGNGLGLTLVKKVIDILGGSIKVESEIGKGTTFTVVLKDK